MTYFDTSQYLLISYFLPFVSFSVQNEKEEVIHIKMNTENLSVSWDQPSDSLSYKEYVVQYKQAAAALGEGFDWIRVNKSHKEEIIKGQHDVDTFTTITKHLETFELRFPSISH